jgi:secreted PhoX family phosphatase
VTTHTSITGYCDGDVDTNTSDNPTLASIVSERYSRRQTLMGGLSATAMAFFGTSLLSACGDDNDAPTVSAGQNGTSSSGRIVTLTGTATDDKAVASVAWTQTAGPTVTLSNAAGNTTTFLAPGVAASTDLKFAFTATDDKGESTTAETTVTITPGVLGFSAVPKSQTDLVSVPAGYTATVVYRLGDPLAAGVSAFANDGSDSNYAQRAGDHHDGMHFFGLSAAGAPDATSNTRGVMAINHENINQSYLHPNGPTAAPRPYAEAIKEMECHGVALVEFAKGANGWAYVPNSTFNRRVTPFTPTAIHGPARGSAQLRTVYSPDATQGRGTINNCANGFTPWKTYLTCEENWAGYFRRDASDVTARPAISAKLQSSLARNGRPAASGGNYGWTTATPPNAGDTSIAKFNITLDPTKPEDGTGDFRFEINQYGWVVEIDPYDPNSVPRKRTALGRFNHEGAWPGAFVAGRKPAWYLGDDATNEYLYKFVSATAWAAADADATDRLAIGDKYLDAGTLYVAKFNADGSGQWLPLVFGQGPLTAANAAYPFADQADVLVNARLAGDALGATKMDRPEWTAVNPVNGEMYLTLTNNSTRTVANTDAANPRAYTDPKVTSGATNGNANGHIIRLKETGDTTEAVAFSWDIYAFGSGSDLDATNINLSGLDASNDFSSPDGLWFGRPSNASGVGKPLMWIETDDGAYTDVTNCMLLCSQPGAVNDGGTKTITNTIAGASATQTTRVGAAPGGNLRRFLVGPKECEITGIDSTPDGKTIFVNIQHPGENGSPANITSNWPQSQAGNASGRPRSATIAITKNDGGVVGL